MTQTEQKTQILNQNELLPNLPQPPKIFGVNPETIHGLENVGVAEIQEVVSKNPKVIDWLNGYNQGGTLNKVGERKRRTLLAGEIREARKQGKEAKQAKTDNSLISSEYKKLANRYAELENSRSQLWSQLHTLKQKSALQNLWQKTQQFLQKDKTDQQTELESKLVEIQKEMGDNRIIREKITSEFSRNTEKMEDQPQNPEKLLEGYYRTKNEEMGIDIKTQREEERIKILKWLSLEKYATKSTASSKLDYLPSYPQDIINYGKYNVSHTPTGFRDTVKNGYELKDVELASSMTHDLFTHGFGQTIINHLSSKFSDLKLKGSFTPEGESVIQGFEGRVLNAKPILDYSGKLDFDRIEYFLKFVAYENLTITLKMIKDVIKSHLLGYYIAKSLLDDHPNVVKNFIEIRNKVQENAGNGLFNSLNNQEFNFNLSVLPIPELEMLDYDRIKAMIDNKMIEIETDPKFTQMLNNINTKFAIEKQNS